MANALFDAYKGVMLGDDAITGFALPDLDGDTIRAFLIDTADDDPDTAADQDVADIAAAARVANADLGSKTVTTGTGSSVFDAADTTFTAVSGDQSEEVVLALWTGTEASSLLLVRFDTFTSGMPVTPNGGDIIIQWNASGIFQL